MELKGRLFCCNHFYIFLPFCPDNLFVLIQRGHYPII